MKPSKEDVSDQEIYVDSLEFDEIETIVKLIHETIDASLERFYPKEVSEFIKHTHSTKIIERIFKNACMLVAKNERHEIVGTGTFMGTRLSNLYIKPAYQGRGIGKRLMKALEEKAIENGVEYVTGDAMMSSIEFCESLGFQRVEEKYVDIENDIKIKYYYIKKKLLT